MWGNNRRLKRGGGVVKSILGKVLIAVVLICASSQAKAATTNLGPVGFGALPFNGTVVPAGPFTDYYTFSLPANSGSDYSVLNFPLSIPSVGTFNTVFTSLTLVSNPDGVLFNSDDVTLQSSVSSVSWGAGAVGNMYLVVSGTANGTLGGLYSGAIAVAPEVVPVPAAIWLLGSGLAGIAVFRRRFRKN
jgi:hypothetical protein